MAGWLRREGRLLISHETIYRHVWRDKRAGRALHTHLRGASKRRRKRYGAYDSRGRLAGKRMISERSPEVEAREVVGHWEADTVMGAGGKDCVFTLAERKTGLVLVGKLKDRTADSLSRRAVGLMRGHGGRFETVTADNGTEFHNYKRVERLTGATFYFARPYHSWERGSNEDANGLLRLLRRRWRSGLPSPASRSSSGDAVPKSASSSTASPKSLHSRSVTRSG